MTKSSMSSVIRDLYLQMLRIRRVEEEIARRYAEQQMRCPVHLSIGQEASAVGVAHALATEDFMVSTHRAHAHYLAKGGRLTGLICELYGKADGCARGQGGSMHLVDWNVGFAASTSIVGGTIPVGVGLAFASWLRGESRVTAVCIGDAAIEEGVFHEAANFASLHKLPVLFVSENNLYSCYTPLKNRQPSRPLTDIAQAHGIRHISLDGNDCYSIFSEMAPILDSLRSGGGPLFVELKTYRHLEHCGPNYDDCLGYRPEEEVKYWLSQDPLAVARKRMESVGLWSVDFEQTAEIEVISEVSSAFELALKSPFPSLPELGAYIYADY